MEVLAVLGITTILMSLMLPALGRARDAGVRSLCLSRARNAALLIQVYTTESRDIYPYAGDESRDGELAVGSGFRYRVGGVWGINHGLWTVMFPDAWEGDQVGRGIRCPKQPDHRHGAIAGVDPDAWPLTWYWLSAAFWLDGTRLKDGVDQDGRRPKPNAASDVTWPSAKAMIFEHAAACWRGPWDWWYISGNAMPRTPLAVIMADGSGSRRVREDDAPGWRDSFAWHYTRDGVRGRDLK
ncbi:MAG: hypothetical protein HRU70_01815 [Phycisphaeraceae bacterium]|nr:MAG: hypothetical protein HRU70_01815 [Phycisphaeraceae bacterium]